MIDKAMQTICLETKLSAAIGGGIRYYDNNFLYTTFQAEIKDAIRDVNLSRFQKEVKVINTRDMTNILYEENNIQLLSNDGSVQIPGLYKYPEKHPILSKVGILNYFLDNGLSSYLPKSFIVAKEYVSPNEIVQLIKNNFLSGSKIVLKHAGIDGNGSGVGILPFEESGSDLLQDVASIINKFSQHFKGNNQKLFGDDYLLQEYISNSLGEGSITFSIQNTSIENLGLVNNLVLGGEYFGSTNVFPYLNKEQIANISLQIQQDFFPLLSQLQQEGVRGYVGFDIVFQKNGSNIYTRVLECNGMHRMPGSVMPNNFAYNTQNNIFVGLPIAKKYLADKYQNFSDISLVQLAKKLESFGTKNGKEQIMNIKCDGIDWGYPVLWLAAAGSSQKDLFKLFHDSCLTNPAGTQYLNTIFEKMST